VPSQDIPCSECDNKKREIEATGNNRVIRCDPIPGRDGWCLMEWEEVWEED
jgi:hypothetical protein